MMNTKRTQKISIAHNYLLLHILIVMFFNVNAQNVGRTIEGFYLINTQGTKSTEVYDFIQFAQLGHHLASKNGKFGYLNHNGSIAIPLMYDVGYPFNGDFALVGNNGTYYHINKSNQVLDSLDWPKAPLVYNRQFLIVNENQNKVFYNDGTELLHTNNNLILAKKGGIIEWNKTKDSIVQYNSLHGTKELKLINTFSVIGEPRITNQGYLHIQKQQENKEEYSVYDQYGKQLVSYDLENIDPNLIQIVWNDFVYLPNGNPNFRANQIGQETHFQMNDLYLKGRNFLSPLSFQLCEKFAADKMVLLKYADKWLSFDGREVNGNYLFDDVVPGDENFTPVKMGHKWYLFERRSDTLIPLPYKEIHPIGMNKGRFFASMLEHGNINEARWAFVNNHSKTATEAIYQVPLLPEEFSIYEQKNRYEWHNNLNEVLKNNKRILLDNYGNEAWTDPDTKATTIQEFFKINFTFEFDNFKTLEKNHRFKKNRVSIFISSIASGISVQIANTKKTDEPVQIQDGYFQTILEMKTKDNTWLKIGFLDPSWCGNSYYATYFPSNKTTSTIINLPTGDETIIVRVVLNEHANNRIESNELYVNTNRARLWVKEYCNGFGCNQKE